MGAKGKLRITESGYASFCPGCNEYHIFDKRWTFDGNFDSPTFTPSLLCSTPEYQDEEWNIASTRCHSFVRAGQWEFLGDCTHELKDKTVPMREEKEDWEFTNG
jgi:hypothetical protein